MTPLFETNVKWAWSKVQVFPGKVVHTTGLTHKEKIILAGQIASIDSGIPSVGKLTLTTNSGEKFEMLVPAKDKPKLIEAIESQMKK